MPKHSTGARILFASLLTFVAVNSAFAESAADVSTCRAAETNNSMTGNNTMPTVIPTLRVWNGGSDLWSLSGNSRIVVHPRSAEELRPVAYRFAEDLAAVTGLTVPVVESGRTRPGDITLSLQSCNDTVYKEIGNEGNTFYAGPDGVVLRANTAVGVLHATRTLLQMLSVDGQPAGMHRFVSNGYAVDYPRLPVRSVMLDVGRLYMSKEFIEDYLRFMSWYKLNTLELHLNDQGFGWNATHTGINPANPQYYNRALRLLSSNFPKLRPTDGNPDGVTGAEQKGYTHADWEEMERVAESYGIEIKPEIDVPSHSGAFLNDRPDLTLPNVSAQWGGTLNMTNPATIGYVESVFDEFMPWFHSRNISIGGDEATSSDIGTNDQVRGAFLTQLAHYVGATRNRQGQRRTVTIWNDAYDKSTNLSLIKNNLIVQNWDGDDDSYIVGDGIRKLINSSGDWYVVPKNNTTSSLGEAESLYATWQASNAVIGGQICEWNDNAILGLNEGGINSALKDMIPASAQIFWSGRQIDASGNTVPYASVATKVSVLNYGPGTRTLSGTLGTP